MGMSLALQVFKSNYWTNWKFGMMKAQDDKAGDGNYECLYKTFAPIHLVFVKIFQPEISVQGGGQTGMVSPIASVKI